jgi:hypothetical protein
LALLPSVFIGDVDRVRVKERAITLRYIAPINYNYCFPVPSPPPLEGIVNLITTNSSIEIGLFFELLNNKLVARILFQ